MQSYVEPRRSTIGEHRSVNTLYSFVYSFVLLRLLGSAPNDFPATSHRNRWLNTKIPVRPGGNCSINMHVVQAGQFRQTSLARRESMNVA